METFNGLRLAQAHQAELVAQAAQDRLAAIARSGRRSRIAELTGWWTARTAPGPAQSVEAAAGGAGCCEPAGAC